MIERNCVTCKFTELQATEKPCAECIEYLCWSPATAAATLAVEAASACYPVANANFAIEGVSPDAKVKVNEQGGKQSDSPYCWIDFSPVAMLEIAKRSGYGQKRYGPDNWKKIPWQEHLNHALTHIHCWLAGDKSDTVAGGHPAAAAWRVIEALGVYLMEVHHDKNK